MTKPYGDEQWAFQSWNAKNEPILYASSYVFVLVPSLFSLLFLVCFFCFCFCFFFWGKKDAIKPRETKISKFGEYLLSRYSVQGTVLGRWGRFRGECGRLCLWKTHLLVWDMAISYSRTQGRGSNVKIRSVLNCERQGKGAVHSVAVHQGLFHREGNNCADPWSLRGVRLTDGEMTIHSRWRETYSC